MPIHADILDFGCGSGRDTKYFLEQGYNVDAVDGSKELCKIASEFTGIEVKNMFFEELPETNKYDGIWACSSILHLPIDELVEVMRKMAQSDFAENIEIDGLQIEYTDVMTGDKNRNRFLYYQLKMSMLKAKCEIVRYEL